MIHGGAMRGVTRGAGRERVRNLLPVFLNHFYGPEKV